MQTHASLHLNFDVQGDQTILRVRKQEPPLRVIRAFPIDTENQTLHHRNEVQRTLSQAIHTNGHYGNDASVGGSGRSAARVNTIAAEEATYAEHADGQTDRIQPVLVHLHNISGGVLGGDQLRLDVAVPARTRSAPGQRTALDGFSLVNQGVGRGNDHSVHPLHFPW